MPIKYYEELRRLKRENPKLGRTMLEHYLRTMFREELERLNLRQRKSTTVMPPQKDRLAKRSGILSLIHF